MGRFGNYIFSKPVNPLQIVMTDSVKPSNETAPAAYPDGHESNLAEAAADEKSATAGQAEELGTPQVLLEKKQIVPEPAEPAIIDRENSADFTRNSEPQDNPHDEITSTIIPPLRTAEEFLATTNEKLSYLVSLQGVPVGNAELEAKNENGEVRIILKSRSNTAMSSVYPVDNITETRHISGNFIITKVRQQEGAFKSNFGFTIFLRDKKVFWIDLLRNRYTNETIPNSEVLDTLSSFYYLRNRPLQIGKTETLHIYDGEAYAPVPIEILRQEEIRLRSFKKVDTLLLRHVQQKGGIFKRIGDVLIWVTNDENKVPVKVETTLPLGLVTAELISAETRKP